MPIETNPQTVAELNETWPPVDDPAREGHLHIQNIKKAVKARAAVTGIFGITTLSSALDSESEDQAATSLAIKNVQDIVTAALDALDASVQDDIAALTAIVNSVSSFVDAEVGNVKNIEIANLGSIKRFLANAFRSGSLSTAFVRLGYFYIQNTGSVRVVYTGDYIFDFNSGSNATTRLLKNGVEIFSETKVQSAVGTGTTSEIHTVDVDVERGDTLELEVQAVHVVTVTGLAEVGAGIRNASIRTAKTKPAFAQFVSV